MIDRKGQREIILKAKCGRWSMERCFSDVRNPGWHRLPCFGGAAGVGGPRSRTELASRSRSAGVVWEMPRQSGGGRWGGQGREGTNVCHEDSCAFFTAWPTLSSVKLFWASPKCQWPLCFPLETLSDLPYGHEVKAIAHGRLVRNDWVT